MSHLQEFARYIRDNKLNELAAEELKHFYRLDVPLMKYVSQMTPEQLDFQVKDGLTRLLNGLESGSALNDLKENLRKWENDELPDIPRNAVSINDIFLINAAQKLSLVSLLPTYSDNVTVGADIVNELENYYTEAHRLAIKQLDRIQELEQQKLQEAEEQYKDLFDNASDLIHILTPAGLILYVNKAWTSTLGYTNDELRGQSIYNYVAQAERDVFKEYRQKVLADEHFQEEIVTTLMSQDGREIIAEGVVSCKFKGNQPVYTRGIMRDITRRRANEKQLVAFNEQLVEREENIRQLIANAPDAVIVINEHSKIILWNEKAETIFGWMKDEVMGKDLTDTIIPPQFREAHLRGMNRLITTGKAVVLGKTIEVPAQDKNGREFYISLTISRSKQMGRSVFIAFLRDIDQQKKNEIELDRKRLELEKTNKELEQYAWLTSHDLKEPLRKILTFSDMLLQKYPADLKDHIQTSLVKINSSATRMNALIEAVLHYSSLSGSGNNSNFKTVDLNMILIEVLSDLEVAINNKHAQIIAPELPILKADEVQMRQLFQNLIANSLKYSKPDVAPVIEITTHTAPEGAIRIEVRDNGIGFEQKYAPKIFQIFQRLGTKSDHEGLGLGLALCKRIVENHKGTISVTSQVGIGTTFEIVLPL